MKTAKTIIFLSEMPITNGVIQTQMLPIVLKTAQRGYQVQILETIGRFDSQEKFRASAEKQLKENNVSMIKIKVPRYTFLPSILYFTLKSYKLLKAIIKKNSPAATLIYARNYKFTPILLLAKYFWNVSYIYSPRGAYIAERKFYRKIKDLLFASFIACLERRTIKNSSATIVETASFKEHLENIYKLPNNKIQVISNYYNNSLLPNNTWNRETMREKLGFTGKKVIVYAGTVEVWYDFSRMFELVSRLKKRDPQIFFQLFLKEDYARNESVGILTNLRKIAQKFGLQEKTDYAISSYSPEKRYLYLSACDAGICLTTLAKFKTMMFYLKLTDYLGANLPIIINREVTEAKNIIEKSECGAIADYENWVTSIDDINPKQLFEINDKYRELIRSYSSSAIIPRYLALFDSILLK